MTFKQVKGLLLDSQKVESTISMAADENFLLQSVGGMNPTFTQTEKSGELPTYCGGLEMKEEFGYRRVRY